MAPIRNHGMEGHLLTSFSGQSRVIAASTWTASRETFTPRRLLFSPWFTTPSDALRRVVSAQHTVMRNGRALLAAAEQVPVLVGRIAAVVAVAELLVSRINGTNTRAAGVIESVVGTGADALKVVGGVQQIEKRINTLIDRCEPIFDAVTEADPGMIRVFEATISELRPLLAELHDAIPEVRGILPVVSRLEPVMVDVETRIAGLPGAARLRRRGSQIIAEADAEAGDLTDRCSSERNGRV